MEAVTAAPIAILCPGQGAQAVGMGKAWHAASAGARRVFAEADACLADSLGAALSAICFEGPAERLNQTDVSQPAIYTCSIACHAALSERGEIDQSRFVAAAGLSLGEYTALHLAGVFSFVDGLQLVRERGSLMQAAAEASRGGMVALIGADDAQAQSICDQAASGEVLVPANFNAPGQIVLSGHSSACARAEAAAAAMGLRAAPLTVAGAFHSSLMQPAADRMADVLAGIAFQRPNIPVWSNVTAQPHDADDMELLKRRLVEQIVRPVRWSHACSVMIAALASPGPIEYHELAPGSILKGLMRRIDRNAKVNSHDEP